MSATNKSEALQLTLNVQCRFAHALEASLITEAEVSRESDTIVVQESEAVFVDMRARWNTVMRGLAAADEALKTLE